MCPRGCSRCCPRTGPHRHWCPWPGRKPWPRCSGRRGCSCSLSCSWCPRCRRLRPGGARPCPRVVVVGAAVLAAEEDQFAVGAHGRVEHQGGAVAGHGTGGGRRPGVGGAVPDPRVVVVAPGPSRRTGPAGRWPGRRPWPTLVRPGVRPSPPVPSRCCRSTPTCRRSRPSRRCCRPEQDRLAGGRVIGLGRGLAARGRCSPGTPATTAGWCSR